MPESVAKNIEDLAAREGFSVGQFFASAATEKLAVMLTMDYLKREAAADRREDFERQRRGTCQPRATPWDRVPIAESPEGAAQPSSRPFRAWNLFGERSQGVALGWYIAPLWG